MCVVFVKVGSVFFFFFNQKTAYEVRISDWSSDVCSSDLDELSGNRPIREIAVPVDLHCAQNRQIDMPAADHRETIGGAEKAGRRKSSNRLLSGVDQIRIYLIVIGEGPDAEHPVF